MGGTPRAALRFMLLLIPVTLTGAPSDTLSLEGARLIQAAGHGDTPAVAALADAGTVDMDAQNHDGMTPLIAACLGGHSQTVSALIAAGANVDVADIHGSTALMYAMFAEDAGHVEAVVALLAAGGASCNGLSQRRLVLAIVSA